MEHTPTSAHEQAHDDDRAAMVAALVGKRWDSAQPLLDAYEWQGLYPLVRGARIVAIVTSQGEVVGDHGEIAGQGLDIRVIDEDYAVELVRS